MDYASQLRLTGIKEQLEALIRRATDQKSSYADYSLELFKTEINLRYQRDLQRRIRTAKLPVSSDLDQYDCSFKNGMSREQLNQLRECMWLEQNYNIVLIGPSGVSKTYIAGGLCLDALKKGYKAYFRTMEQIVEMIKMKDITRSAMTEYRKLMNAHLVVIDDIMMFALDKQQAVGLFHFVNHLHEKASFIVTTNMFLLIEKVPPEYHDSCKSILRAAAFTYVIGVVRNFVSLRFIWLMLSRVR